MPAGHEALPSGTLTFVLTDVEGSTRLWDAAPDAMAAAQRRHDELIADEVVGAGGRLVKSKGEGDSTFSVFTDPVAAVRAAEQIREGMRAEAWPTPDPVRIRIGVSTGVAELRDGDYFGTAVVRAARIRALAAGDEVLLGASAYALVADALRDRTFVDRGEHELKGLQRPERVYALESDIDSNASRPRRPVTLVAVGAAVVLVGVVVALLVTRGGDHAAKAAAPIVATTTTVPKPAIEIASIELTTTPYYTHYTVAGTAARVQIPPYQIRVLARDPTTHNTWLWSYPAKVDANGRWTGVLEVPLTEPHVKVSAVVILPPDGDTSPTAPSQLPLTDPPTPFEHDLTTHGPSASGVVALSGS